MSYEDRLKELRLMMLDMTRQRTDLIKVYTILGERKGAV